MKREKDEVLMNQAKRKKEVVEGEEKRF